MFWNYVTICYQIDFIWPTLDYGYFWSLFFPQNQFFNDFERTEFFSIFVSGNCIKPGFRTVEKSVNITAFGTHTIEGELHHVSDHFRVQAHEPMEWQPGLPTSANTINGNDANVLCAATQKGGVLTGIVKITWLRAKDLSQIFSGSGGFQISDGEQEVDGATYSTSTLKFKPEDNSLHKFICVAKLIAGQKQHTLQTIQHNVSVEVGGNLFSFN